MDFSLPTTDYGNLSKEVTKFNPVGDFGKASNAVDVTGLSDSAIRAMDVGSKGLSSSAVGLIGSGADAAMKIAGGITTGVSTKRARELAEARSMQEIAKARFQRQQDADDQAEQDKFDKQQAQFANMKANTGLRLNMFARDLQKQAQKFQDGRNAIAKFRQKEAINNNFRSQLTGAVGGQ